MSVVGDYYWPAHWPAHDLAHDTQSCLRCQDEAEWAEDHDDCPCLDHRWETVDVGTPAVPDWQWMCRKCLRLQGPAYAGGVP